MITMCHFEKNHDATNLIFKLADFKIKEKRKRSEINRIGFKLICIIKTIL